jgi:OHCU decarboxylase
MRSDPGEYELVAPGSLSAVLTLLTQRPGEWLPIAGGTDVMVQYAAGNLASRKLVSISNLSELRRIEVLSGEVRIGAGCTYTQIREHPILVREFPPLTQAARWTGGIANQNRGTLGGNIVNASPAADSLPALLAYDADLILISVRGERRLPYADFHTGYKKTRLASDELILSVSLPRRFSGYVSLARKVGARNAQAISKVCMAALALTEDDTVKDVRIAVGSVAPVPLRLRKTEQIVKGGSITASLISLARKTAMQEVAPIDDIRSTARYRTSVTGNLVAEFLRLLIADEKSMNAVLARWNELPFDEAVVQILSCCGSQSWAREMATHRPFQDESTLAALSDEVWRALSPSDWMEAFRSHPRIGESVSSLRSSEASATWAGQEQKSIAEAGDAIKIALAKANREYENKFGHIFIVCATGKSAPEMLEILTRRMNNDPETEFNEAAEQQRQITQLRLKKWLQP